METQLEEPLEVVSDTLNVDIEAKPRVIVEPHCQHDKHPQGEADFAQPSDANFQAADDGSCRDGSDGPDDDNLAGNALCNHVFSASKLVGKAAKGSVDLYDPNAQTGAHAKHGADNRHDVDHVTQCAIDLVSQDRVETRAHGHGQVVTVSDEAQQQANQNVDNPTMNSPMEQSDVDGVLGTLVVRVSEG